MRSERLTTAGQIRDLILWHNENSSHVVIDTETDSKEARLANLIDIQLTGREEEHVVIFSADHRKELVELSPEITLVAHNTKYDLHVLFRHGVDLLERPFRDTLIMGHLVNENRESYSLDSYIKEIYADNYKEEFWKKYISYQDAPQDEKDTYATKDVYYTGCLFRSLGDDLCKEGIPLQLVDHAHRLQRALLRTETQGIAVDRGYLESLGVKLTKSIEALKPRIREAVEVEVILCETSTYNREVEKRSSERGKASVKYPEFSFDSTQQLQELLYHELRLTRQYNEKTKKLSTDEASLRKIETEHPVIPLILAYREDQKVFTSYVEGTYKRIDNGRIYPSFRVAGTKTGRISHSNPNLGQLPRKGGVRGIYIPDPGNVFLSADYCQLEVCLEANLTKCPQLARIFKEGLSKHDITAKELGIERQAAKTLNFALQYWASHYKVAKLLGITPKEGEKVWKAYWNLYKGPKELKAKTDAMVNSGEAITTLFGRKRRFERRDRWDWDADYRQAYNFLIQGTGADITSKAFYLISEYLRKNRMGRGLFSLHDEVIVEVKSDFIAHVENKMLEVMVSVGEDLKLEIPLKAESSGPQARWTD